MYKGCDVTEGLMDEYNSTCLSRLANFPGGDIILYLTFLESLIFEILERLCRILKTNMRSFLTLKMIR